MNPNEESLMFFGDAQRWLAQHWHQHDQPVSRSTLTNWANRGIAVPGGRVKLRAFKIGIRWATTLQALQDFLQTINPVPAYASTHNSPNDMAIGPALST